MQVNYVVQFNENHKWVGCLGIITEIKQIKVMESNKFDLRYTVAVPIPEKGTAYIYVLSSEHALEFIGDAKLIPNPHLEDQL